MDVGVLRHGVVASAVAAALLVAACTTDEADVAPTDRGSNTSTTAPTSATLDVSTVTPTTSTSSPVTGETIAATTATVGATSTPGPADSQPVWSITLATTPQLVAPILELPCNEIVPIRTLPGGQPTNGAVSIDEGTATWGVEPGGAPTGDNIITEVIGGATDDDAIRIARQAPISGTQGPLTVSVVPGVPPSEATELYLFVSDRNCVRVLRTNPLLDATALDQYAHTLLGDLLNG